MPEQSRLVCARLDEEGIPLVEIYETAMMHQEFIEFWKNKGWQVMIPTHWDGSRIRCSKKNHIVEVLIDAAPGETARQILVHSTNTPINQSIL